jgi:homoserine kinase type II
MNSEKLITRALQGYSLGKLKSFSALSRGFANKNYKTVTEQGTFLFRIFLQQSRENVVKEHQMLAVLQKAGFPTAYPVPDKSGKTLQVVEQFPVALYDFIEGTIPLLNPETVSQTAAALSLLHTVDPKAVPPKPNSLRPEKVANLVKRFPTGSHPLQDVLDKFARQWQQVEPFLRQPLPTGPIHGDLFPDNTLFEGNRLKAIIDFEEFCTDHLLFDVAMTINGFCFTDNRLDKKLLTVFLKTYESRRRLTAREHKLLPVYLRWTALAMASWHLRYPHFLHPSKKQEKRIRELLTRVENLSRPL